MKMILAGDIGGTKTDLALFSPETGPRIPLKEARFLSEEYDSLEVIVREFLSQIDEEVTHASFGVAGPVVDGRAELTNLPWQMEAQHLQNELSLKSVHLLNDLVSTANAVPVLAPEDLFALREGKALAGGTIAVIAPGTGLGEGFLTWDGATYRPYPSEGGHASFSPTNDLEIEMLRFLQQRFRHVSWERICSGVGLPNIYTFFKETGRAEEPVWLAEKLAAADDITPIVVNNALAETDPPDICVKTLDMFIATLGAEAGNLALKLLATGGVYLGGGIPPRILSKLKGERFVGAFLHKGRLGAELKSMPIYVILNPKAALIGAARHGLDQAAQASM
jgi:glucokinase